MTDPTEGRDGPPSVAALAIHVNALRRDIEDLTAKVGAVVAKQREHTAVLHDLTNLRQQVEQILGTLSGDGDDSPITWFWLTMSDQERDEKFAELHDWVETVLRVQYPDYLADHIPPCWPNHPRGQVGTGLALPALVLRLPDRQLFAERCGGLARPLVPWGHSPLEPIPEPVRRDVPRSSPCPTWFEQFMTATAQRLGPRCRWFVRDFST